jgi:hypothetical protein
MSGSLWIRQGRPCHEAEGKPGALTLLEERDLAVRDSYVAYVALIPSGKRIHNYEKSPFLMGKSTINHHFQ